MGLLTSSSRRRPPPVLARRAAPPAWPRCCPCRAAPTAAPPRAQLNGCGYNDMTFLPVLTKDAILDCLLKRFKGELVYTYVGDIVISVNPFKNTGCVGKAIRAKYKGLTNKMSVPPHVYALVDATYSQMMMEGKSQSILISGESGAGKTEAMKVALTYIGELSAGKGKSGGNSEVATRLMQTNPVMEGIGNAKTVRNNNSSRFGKHFDVQFAESGAILGAFTSIYLLEKPRIVNHMRGERNYHIFYMVCKAAESIRDPVNIQKWQKYGICQQDGTVAEVTTWDDNAEMKDMHKAAP
jgi:myosin heavy subunit